MPHSTFRLERDADGTRITNGTVRLSVFEGEVEDGELTALEKQLARGARGMGPRAACRACGRTISLNQDGSLRRHRAQSANRGSVCRGSGQAVA